MNVILGILGVAMALVLIDVAYLIHKELQDSEAYHARIDRMNDLHNDTLTNTKGARE